MNAIEAIAQRAGDRPLPDRPGISVKLSALHPRYEATNGEAVLADLTPRLIELSRLAKAHDLNLTVDAEEADRLELSLDVFAAALADPSLADWEGAWPRHSGLSEAGAGRDRLRSRSRQRP